MNTQSLRHLPWPACYNTRDLGGYQTSDGRQTRWRVLVRSDNLCRLSPQGQATLVAYGVGTIIDVRSAYELDISPHFFMSDGRDGPPVYLNLPLQDETDREAIAAVNTTPTLAAMYNVMLERFSSQIVAIMQAVATAVPGSVLIHCHAGKDRTGLVIALLLALAGVPGQAIAEDYAASHLYLRPLYDAALAEAAGDPQRQALLAHHLGAKAETMLATLIYLEEQHGGVEPYLLASGLTAAEIKQIRYRLCV